MEGDREGIEIMNLIQPKKFQQHASCLWGGAEGPSRIVFAIAKASFVELKLTPFTARQIQPQAPGLCSRAA